MHKQGLLTTFVALLFSMTPALADHHKGSEMGTEYEQQSTTNGAEQDSHKGMEHPAKEMGDEVKSKEYNLEEDVSEEYKENVEDAKDSKGTKHPAHDMGEGEEMLDERGVE